MNVRKQRLHQCGLTNIDYRTKGDMSSVDRYQPNMTFADTGPMSKAQFKPRLPSESTFREKWQTAGGWLPLKKLDPKTEHAKSFYIDKSDFKMDGNVRSDYFDPDIRQSQKDEDIKPGYYEPEKSQNFDNAIKSEYSREQLAAIMMGVENLFDDDEESEKENKVDPVTI